MIEASDKEKDVGEGFTETCINSEFELSDIFYTSQKKGHVFRVKLNAKGFILQRESNVGIKNALQTVNMTDIVGGRCMRLKKPRRLGGACGSCTSSSSMGGARSKNTDLTADADSNTSAYLYVFAYVLKKNRRRNVRRERTVLTLRFRSFDSFEENMHEAERWYKALKWYKNDRSDSVAHSSLSGYENCRQRLLIFLNPKSGSGKARELFHQQVAPILNEAELPYDLYVTKHANYARDFVRVRNLSTWSGIVSVGGDGLFYEVLNGLLQRPDWESVLQHMPLGVVPCGSGNGLARSIAHLYQEPYEQKPILGAALTIISGQSAPMDVVRIELQNQIMYSFLSVGWGLISDIDIESERLRSLGYQRFTLWTLHRLISLRTYRGRVAYLVKDEVNLATTDDVSCSGTPYKSTLNHSRSCNTYLNQPENYRYYQSFECIGSSGDFEDIISLETSGKQSLRSRCDSWFSVGSRKSTYFSIAESMYHSVAGDSDIDADRDFIDEYSSSGGTRVKQALGPGANISALHDPIPDIWTVEEGEFIMVHAAYQTHLGIDCFFAPDARLNDGIIYLVIIRAGISRSQLLNFLINMSSGTHLPTKPNEFVKVVPVTAFRIEPHSDNGIITVDGERVEFGAIQGEVFPGIANIMVPK